MNGIEDLTKSPHITFCPSNPLDIREGLSEMDTNKISVWVHLPWRNAGFAESQQYLTQDISAFHFLIDL